MWKKRFKDNNNFLKQIEIYFEPRKKYANNIDYVRSEEIKEIFSIYDKLREIPNLTIKNTFINGGFDEYGYTDFFLGVKINLQGSDECLTESLKFLNNQERYYQVRGKGKLNKKQKIETEKFLNKIKRDLESKV
ncbi:MAG: hypothetical protein KJ566_02680 [Nanoarchaeota archaeon]|nr:hypothetical protein [Nanoarchaeota archaeon]